MSSCEVTINLSFNKKMKSQIAQIKEINLFELLFKTGEPDPTTSVNSCDRARLTIHLEQKFKSHRNKSSSAKSLAKTTWKIDRDTCLDCFHFYCLSFLQIIAQGNHKFCLETVKYSLHELLPLSCTVEQHYFNRKFSIKAALLDCFTLVVIVIYFDTNLKRSTHISISCFFTQISYKTKPLWRQDACMIEEV